MNEIKVLDHGLVRLVASKEEDSSCGMGYANNRMLLTFEVTAPTVILADWGWPWYYDYAGSRFCEKTLEFYIPDVKQILRNQRNPKGQEFEAEEIQKKMKIMVLRAIDLYYSLLDQNVPRELARTVLPLSIYSHLITSLTINALFRFLDSWLNSRSKYEMRTYAQAMLDLAATVAPNAVQEFNLRETK